MASQTPLARFRSTLKSRMEAARKAVIITELAPTLPNAAFAVMDEHIDAADPLVKVAIMDAYFEMTDDGYYEEDLVAILDDAERAGDAGEELYMAARLALGRINRRSADAMDVWGDAGLEIVGVRARRGRGLRAAGPRHQERITIIIHGTWAADGTWWRPAGDFFEYVRRDLRRHDIYDGSDQFSWSGKNRDASRRKASTSLAAWLRSHPSAEVNVFAHSHGANVAMLATHDGIKIDRLVMLSPPVRKDYFAKWSNVKAAYNIQADHDPVVAIARGGKWLASMPIARFLGTMRRNPSRRRRSVRSARAGYSSRRVLIA